MGLHHLGTAVLVDQASGLTGTTLSPRAVETNQENRETLETTYQHVTDCLFYPVIG